MLESARWMVSTGDTIDIRKDRWLASGELAENNDGYDLIWVRDIIDPNSESWDVSKIRRNFAASTAFKIMQTPISWNCGNDQLWWPGAKSGEFQ